MENKASFVLGFILLFFRVSSAQETVVDVTTLGAKPDGTTDNTAAFMQAWNAVCKSTTPAKLLVPEGNFVTHELIFAGPCTAPAPLVIEIQGTLLACTDLKGYTRNTWILIEHVCGVKVTGQGTLKGQGEASWQLKEADKECRLPDSLVFMKAKDSSIEHLHFCNSKGYHMKICDCENMQVDDLHINAPGDSPNTDGIHVSGSTNVNIMNTDIATGDDCVSIGDGTKNVVVNGVKCGPGHGLSIGSLGRREGERDVDGITIKNCSLCGTTNGARIKTFRESPVLTASNIIFEDLTLENVKNPIIIDQNYESKTRKEGSNVKLTGIQFKKIRGSSVSEVGVTLNCSCTVPCEVELADIDLTFSGQFVHEKELVSRCVNAKPTFTGKNCPPPCPM